ncbi:MAG: hypothetical protein QNM02_00485 [Acidimicrobiia bacterium]|jgi:hypothetical protein|nr:hypothetical protein [Acidimicrobiia bacterium]
MLGQDRVRGPSELSGASGLVQYDNDRLGWSGDQRSNETSDVVFPNDRVVAGH